MLNLLQQLQKTDDTVTLLVGEDWFEGVVTQVDAEIILLQNKQSDNGAYYSTAIRIDLISVIQFTTDFRPNKFGALVSNEIEE